MILDNWILILETEAESSSASFLLAHCWLMGGEFRAGPFMQEYFRTPARKMKEKTEHRMKTE